MGSDVVKRVLLVGLVVPVVAAGLVLFGRYAPASAGPNGDSATPTSYSSSTGRSCVGAADGQESSFSMTATNTYVWRFKCYYGSSLAQSNFVPTGSNQFCLGRNTSASGAMAVGTAGSVSGWLSPATVDVSATGYVEFHLSVYRQSGSASISIGVSVNTIPVIDAQATASCPNHVANTAENWNVPASAFAAAKPTHYYQSLYTAHECEGSTVSLTPAQVSQGGSFTFTTAAASFSGEVISYRLRPGSAWVVLPNNAATVVPVTGAAISSSSVVVRCTTTASPTYRYIAPGSSATYITSLTAPAVDACDQVTVGWPEPKLLAVGDNMPFLFSAPAAVGPVSVTYTMIDTTVGTGAPLTGSTWTAVPSMTSVTGAYSTAWTPTASYGSQGPEQVWLRCTDAGGRHSDQQWFSLWAIGTVSVEDDGNCEPGHIGLSPSSWVPALVQNTKCALVELFVPSDDAVDDLWTSGESLVTDNAPLGYGVAAFDFLTGLPDEMADGVDTGTGRCTVLIPSDYLDDVGVELEDEQRGSCFGKDGLTATVATENEAFTDEGGVSYDVRFFLAVLLYAWLSWVVLKVTFRLLAR